MTELIHHFQYLIAWIVYLLAGLGCTFIGWKLSGFIRHSGWRDLARGIMVVLIFTPWYTDASHLFLAPASFILLMDLLLEGAKGGLQGGLALLLSLFTMLVGLTLRLVFWQGRKSP